MSPLPAAEWSQISANFLGPLPSGEYLLVLYDEYSRFPVVKSITSTSAVTVVPVLDRILTLLGKSDQLKPDNRPPWSSIELKKYDEYLGFTHRRVMPLWPESNGFAEKFVVLCQKYDTQPKLKEKTGSKNYLLSFPSCTSQYTSCINYQDAF